MSGYKYTLIFVFGLCGPGIIDKRNMYRRIMHIGDGNLYTQTTIGHIEYGLAAFEYSKKSFARKPRRTLGGSAAKDV